MSKLKIGIIGVGGIGQYHIASFQKVEGAEVAAICDPNRAKLADVGNRCGIADRYTDAARMLRKADVEAVVVCTPNVHHVKMSLAALEAGKHVLCEKPLALVSKELEKVLAKASKVRRIFMGAMSWRFFPSAEALKNYVMKGNAGHIYYSRASYIRRRGIPGLGGWFTTKKLSGGGALLDIGVHMLDLVVWIMGNPRAVGVCGAAYQKFRGRAIDGGWPPAGSRVGDVFKGTFDVDDFAVGYVRFADGATLVLESCWSSNNEPYAGIRFYGDRAGALVDSKELRIYAEDEGGMLLDIIPQLSSESNYLREARHFADCVKNRKKPLTKPEEMLNVARILEAFYKSSAQGKEIRLTGRK